MGRGGARRRTYSSTRVLLHSRVRLLGGERSFSKERASCGTERGNRSDFSFFHARSLDKNARDYYRRMRRARGRRVCRGPGFVLSFFPSSSSFRSPLSKQSLAPLPQPACVVKHRRPSQCESRRGASACTSSSLFRHLLADLFLPLATASTALSLRGSTRPWNARGLSALRASTSLRGGRQSEGGRIRPLRSLLENWCWR
jgi:hypothetical protein